MKMKKILLGTCSAVLLLLVFALALTSCPNSADSDNGMLTVTYNANGVSIAVPAPQKALPGGIVYVAALQGSVTGKSFIGWNTKSDGSGSIYGAGDPLTVDEGIVLYAEWTGGDESPITDEYTVSLKRLDYLNDSGNPRYVYQAICLPEWLSDDCRITKDQVYILNYSFKSDTPMPVVYGCSLMMQLADSTRNNPDINSFPYMLSFGKYLGDEIPANTEISGTFEFTATSTSENDSSFNNCLWLYTSIMEGPGPVNETLPTLTFTTLTLAKETDTPHLIEVTANGHAKGGSSGKSASTEISLEFDRPIFGLTANDIDILGFGVSKGVLTGSGTTYVLKITIGETTFDTVTPNVRVKNIFGMIPVTLYTVDQAGTGVTLILPAEPLFFTNFDFISMTANGNSNTSTTQLTLTFDRSLGPLTKDNIKFKASSAAAVTLGTVTGPVSSGANFVYTAQVTSVNKAGALDVYISKTSYMILNNLRSAQIYADWASKTYDGTVGRGYDILNSPYYEQQYVKTWYALNMPKLDAHGYYAEDPFRELNAKSDYIIGESMSSYSREFSEKVAVSGSCGMFSASIGVDYKKSTSVATHDSFAVLFSELVRRKDFLKYISIANLRNNYLDEGFKNDWLLNTAKTPDEVFTRFGTHIILTAFMGGRMDLNFQYHNESRETSQQIKVKVDAAYAFIKGSSTTEQTETATSFASKSVDTVRVTGGTVNVGPTLAAAMNKWDSWADHIQNTPNLSIVKSDVNDPTQMLPIWELIDPALPGMSGANGRIQKFINAYRDQLGKNEAFLKSLQGGGDFYVNWLVAGCAGKGKRDLAWSNMMSSSDDKVYGINTCLNTGISNSGWVFLGYTATGNTNNALRDVKARIGKDPPATIALNNITYYLLNMDMNANAGGDYIYLYVTKDTRAGAPIKNVFVEVNGNIADRPGDTGWSRVRWTGGGDADMNKGAGGAYIYIDLQR